MDDQHRKPRAVDCYAAERERAQPAASREYSEQRVRADSGERGRELPLTAARGEGGTKLRTSDSKEARVRLPYRAAAIRGTMDTMSLTLILTLNPCHLSNSTGVLL